VPQGRLLVTDEDNSLLSHALTGAFGRGPLSKMVLVENVSREGGRDRINRGDGSAYLIIPKGLQDAYLRNQPFRLQLFTNPGQRILPKIIGETLSIAVDGGFYLQRFASEQLRAIHLDQAPSDEVIVRTSRTVNQLVARLRKYLFPPLIDLEMAVIQAKTETQSFASLFFPPMFFMALLFVAKALSGEIWHVQESLWWVWLPCAGWRVSRQTVVRGGGHGLFLAAVVCGASRIQPARGRRYEHQWKNHQISQ